MKLGASKCQFICEEVDYIGHFITPQGLKTNWRLMTAVKEFPRPWGIQEVHRFLGLSSYYRRFIAGFSQIAQPLYALMCKGAMFHWSDDCEQAMVALKDKLSEAQVLAYPSFNCPFVLETDASAAGLGAIQSQPQDDDKLYPVAYASHSLSAPERNMELETLAVVWAISHFCFYLYGHSVTVLTDHSAVKAILETTNPSGKYARWWLQVYGSGVGDVKITYRPGRLNSGADALSRNPHEFPPAHGTGEGEVQVATVSKAKEPKRA